METSAYCTNSLHEVAEIGNTMSKNLNCSSRSTKYMYMFDSLWIATLHIKNLFQPSSSSTVFCPKASPSLQAEKPRLKFCRRQVFHRKLMNKGCSFTRDLIGAVASHYFPHPTLSLASEQTLKDLQNRRGINEEVRRVDLANWALRTSPKFATRVKHQISIHLCVSRVSKDFWAFRKFRNFFTFSPLS